MSELFFSESTVNGGDGESLEQRITAIERRLQSSRVFSTTFLARAMAVWGHAFVAHILLMIAVGIFMGLLLPLFSR